MLNTKVAPLENTAVKFGSHASTCLSDGTSTQAQVYMSLLMKKCFLLLSATALIAVAIVHNISGPNVNSSVSIAADQAVASGSKSVSQGTDQTMDYASKASILAETAMNRATESATQAPTTTMMDQAVSELKLQDTPLLQPSFAQPHLPRTDSMQGGGGGGGFVLSCNYWEELTSATRNLASLQCWAGQLNMSVVEPVVRETYLSFPFGTAKRDRDTLHWRDVFDIDHWNHELHERKRYAALTSWESFLSKAPRNLIVVNIRYSQAAAEKGAPKCSTGAALVDAVQTLQTFKFRVTRQACIDFSLYKDLSTEQFHREIFGELEPSTSTVLFSQWRGGLGSTSRIRVSNSDCALTTEFLDAVVPSQRLLRDAETYATTYLKTRDYVAIMIRLQKAKKITSNVTQCFQQSLQMWNRIVKDSGINATFLSADVSRFGSAVFRQKSKKIDMYDAFGRFFNAIYSHQLTTREWENTFERTSAHPGYVGVLQKVIASRARCLLLVGGGSYQYHALRLHQKMHPTSHCVYIVKECTHEKIYTFLAQPEQHPAN